MKEHHDWETNIHHIHQLFATIIEKCEVNKHKTFYKTCKGYFCIQTSCTSTRLSSQRIIFFRNILESNATVESNDELSLFDEDVVEDDKILCWRPMEMMMNGHWRNLHQILASVIWNKFLQRNDLSLKNFSLPVPKSEKGAIHPKSSLGSLYCKGGRFVRGEKPRCFLRLITLCSTKISSRC